MGQLQPQHQLPMHISKEETPSKRSCGHRASRLPCLSGRVLPLILAVAAGLAVSASALHFAWPVGHIIRRMVEEFSEASPQRCQVVSFTVHNRGEDRFLPEFVVKVVEEDMLRNARRFRTTTFSEFSNRHSVEQFVESFTGNGSVPCYQFLDDPAAVKMEPGVPSVQADVFSLVLLLGIPLGLFCCGCLCLHDFISDCVQYMKELIAETFEEDEAARDVSLPALCKAGSGNVLLSDHKRLKSSSEAATEKGAVGRCGQQRQRRIRFPTAKAAHGSSDDSEDECSAMIRDKHPVSEIVVGASDDESSSSSISESGTDSSSPSDAESDSDGASSSDQRPKDDVPPKDGEATSADGTGPRPTTLGRRTKLAPPSPVDDSPKSARSTSQSSAQSPAELSLLQRARIEGHRSSSPPSPHSAAELSLFRRPRSGGFASSTSHDSSNSPTPVSSPSRVPLIRR
eukprot:TRINITY_DN7801_c0_g6_i1.p1 TRINITY_DN7801_c0_g6~~TRINITY_DN7801_c0_g6_i1.p1  ORF type:complete len:456 (-),score=55.90 TRINITY_DN7801_c0_g6_i1:97-1464(-)